MSTWSRLVFEKDGLGIPGIHSIGQYNYVAAREGLPPHRHTGCVEISFLAKGHQTYRVGGETFQVKGGEQYISLPGDVHDTGRMPQDKGVLYWVILDVTKSSDEFLFLSKSMSHRLISGLREFPTRHFAAHPSAHATLERAFQSVLQIRVPDECTGIYKKSVQDRRTSRKKACGSPNETFPLLEAASHLVCYILQTVEASRGALRKGSPVIEASLDFIHRNEEKWLSVAQLAENADLSESYFKILFREEVGIPPAEYMLRRKVEVAKGALAEPECNITDLAFRLGFSSSQYFATVFRRFTNLTPSNYMQGKVPDLVEIH